MIEIEHIIVGAIATNCWIIPLAPFTGGAAECALIDPGADSAAIIARLKRQNLRPRYILLTHSHFDHIAALPDLAAAYGEALEIAIHRAEAERLGPESREIHRRDFAAAGDPAYVDILWKPMPCPTRLLSEGDAAGPFRVLHLPGHSPGSAGFLLEKEKLLFSGDTLFRAGIGRTDLPGGDWNDLRKSLGRLFAMDGDIRVYPGHGPVTSLAAERWYGWESGV
ncbi:MAG: MBL fold metallo-hydrolase [Spirochaetaceae bacterium]|jgi:glyoxylase-like metal-dependent hydrolase (beta-lactamase superfamily II)|nr:MBL fold metallo-hydrolase [Spirochaetaceae bacterium]